MASPEIHTGAQTSTELTPRNSTEILAGKLECSVLYARAIRDAKESISHSKPQRLAQLARLEFAGDQDPQATLNEAVQIASGWTKDGFMERRDEAFAEIVTTQIAINQVDKAYDSAKGMEQPYYRAKALQQVAIAMYERGEDPNEALGLAASISRQHTRGELAVTYAKVGQIDEALRTADKLDGDEKNLGKGGGSTNVHIIKSKALAEIAQIQAQGKDINSAMQTVQKIPFHAEKAVPLAKIAEAQFNAGQDPSATIEEAIKNAEFRIVNSGDMYAFLEIAKVQHAVGIDPNPTLDKVRKQNYGEARLLAALAKTEFEIGLDPTKTLQEAKEKSKGGSLAIAGAEIIVGKDPSKELIEAFKQAESVPLGQDKADALIRIASFLRKASLSPQELAALPPETVTQLLTEVNSRLAAEAAGYFNKVDVDAFKSLPAHAQTSVLVGRAIGTEQDERSKNKLLTEARNIVLQETEDEPARLSMRNFVEGVVSTQDYDIASNTLLGTLNQLQRLEDNRSREAQTIRLLRGLINIDNPKGKTIATQLFAQTSLEPRYREYIAKLLFSTGYWDANLGNALKSQVVTHFKEGSEEIDKTMKRVQHPIRRFRENFLRKLDPSREQVTELGLKESLTGEEFELKHEQAAVLSALINDFGLTPDLPAYELLEKQGVLVADTIEGRVVELKSKLGEFQGKSRDDLIDLFKKDPGAAKIYYVLKAGEYRYSVVNDYSLEKFQKITARVGELKVHRPTLEKFQTVLTQGGLSQEQAQSVITDLEAGRPVIVSPDRTIRFSSQVEYGSAAELAVQRLQDVWLTELKSLLISRAAGLNPQTIGESVQVLDNTDLVESNKAKIGNIVRPLKIDREKITYDDIKVVVKDLKNRLESTYRSSKNKDGLARIANMSDSGVLGEYLQHLLPPSESAPATTEWFSHLQEILTALEEAKAQRVTTPKADRELELTFLDKNEDFVRSLRFADAAQCCFNASNANFDQRTYEFVTRLNKDPLSFMMDLKQANSKVIQGFVFGRMGINPETGKPVVMLNGVYSQLKGPVIVDNILRIIEEQMGKRLNADSLVIASQYGGKIDQPNGYNLGSMQLEAIRALQDDKGNLGTTVYDDIGRVANGRFSFNGYIKNIAA